MPVLVKTHNTQNSAQCPENVPTKLCTEKEILTEKSVTSIIHSISVSTITKLTGTSLLRYNIMDYNTGMKDLIAQSHRLMLYIKTRRNFNIHRYGSFQNTNR